jgi:hypothetical protein
METALSPGRKPWTTDDSVRLRELFREHGPQWALLARLLGHVRSDYELRKLFLSEHKGVYAQWAAEHDVPRRGRPRPPAPTSIGPGA